MNIDDAISTALIKMPGNAKLVIEVDNNDTKISSIVSIKCGGEIEFIAIEKEFIPSDILYVANKAIEFCKDE